MRATTVVPIVLVASLAVALPARADTVEENQRIVLAMIEAINARDLDALDALVAPDVVRHSGATPGLVVESLEQFKAFLRSDFATVPDSVQTVNLIFGADDMVAVHVTYAGTQQGPMGPFPATGKPLELPFIGLARIEEGRIAELWAEWDNLNALTQLGLFPPPEAAEPPPSGDSE